MKKFLISVNGTQYEVDVEEVTGTAGASAMTQPVAPQAAPASAPVEKAVTAVAAPVEKAAVSQPVQPKPAAATASASAAVPSAAPAGSQIINCPMPGTILKVSVAVGETVKKNQVLCVLEAMKMENDIVSPRDAVVAGVMVTKGASVNAGDPMISLK